MFKIMIVTLGFRPRRQDPITFNAFHFSAANLLTTLYAAVMLGKGIRFKGSYHYHMEDWLTDPGCSFVGCLLIIATLVSAILYMIEVICMFMKLRYPLKVDRHMTIKRLNITVGCTWLFAIFIGIIPFMTKRSFNAVGLCVPFYNDGVLPFKYVIFYTVILNRIRFGILNHKTRTVIFVSRLANAANIDHAFFAAQLKQIVWSFVRLYERTAFSKDTWNVGMSLKTKLIETLH